MAIYRDKVSPPALLCVLLFFAALLVLAGCDDGGPGYSQPGATQETGLSGTRLAGTWAESAARYGARLSGAEVIPSVQTDARGSFSLAVTGDLVEVELKVERIQGVSSAHIHSGPRGFSGPVLATLVVSSGQRAVEDTLFVGRLSPAHLEADRLPGQDVEDLVALLATGDTYVDIHTAAHEGGEIRGQIDPLPLDAAPAAEAAGGRASDGAGAQVDAPGDLKEEEKGKEGNEGRGKVEDRNKDDEPGLGQGDGGKGEGDGAADKSGKGEGGVGAAGKSGNGDGGVGAAGKSGNGDGGGKDRGDNKSGGDNANGGNGSSNGDGGGNGGGSGTGGEV